MNNLDDPRLTALALGELEDEAFEADLDAAARAEVEDIRAIAAQLETALSTPASDGLTAAQKQELEQAARPSAAGVDRSGSSGWWLALAAGLALAIGLGLLANRTDGPAERPDVPSPAIPDAAPVQASASKAEPAVAGMSRPRPSAGGFVTAADHPRSQVPIDADSAAYTSVQAALEARGCPSPEVVRVEELINYFDYGYPEPRGIHPLSVTSEVVQCPWRGDNRLVRIGLKARSAPARTIVAEDVRLAVRFDRRRVESYRLLGYDHHQQVESAPGRSERGVAVGAGHTATALYEVVPHDRPGALLNVELHYKRPARPEPVVLTYPVNDSQTQIADAGEATKTATSAAVFGMLLRQRPLAPAADITLARALAPQSRPDYTALIDDAEQLMCL